MTALGTFASLVSRDSASASNRALIPALLLSGSFLIWYVPSRYSTVFMGAGSPPIVNWLCLISNGDVRDVMNGSPTFRRLENMNVHSYESPLRVLTACLFSIAVFSAAALGLSRAAFNRFDRIAGRPERVHVHLDGRRGALSRASRRKRAVVIVVLIIIVLGITMVVWLERGERSLRDALAETDRLFPAWRLDDLEAARQRVPDQKNSALLVSSAAQLLPPSWRSAKTGPSRGEQKQLELIASVSPERQLSPASLRSLSAAVEQAGPALAEAAVWQTSATAGSRSPGPATGYRPRCRIWRVSARLPTCYSWRRFSSPRRARWTNRLQGAGRFSMPADRLATSPR